MRYFLAALLIAGLFATPVVLLSTTAVEAQANCKPPKVACPRNPNRCCS